VTVRRQDGDRQPVPYLRTRFNETGGRVSPNGRWLTYQSDESGTVECYVQSFPDPGGKYQVTTRGGVFSAWSRDGKRLRYILSSVPNTVFASDILPGPEFHLGPSRIAIVLPEESVGGSLAHDGRRLFRLLPTGAPAPPTVTVVIDGLPRR